MDTPNFKKSKEVTTEIIEKIISNFEVKGDLSQIRPQILPIVSNAMFLREKEILENERFETLITLARTLDDETVKKVIKALKYKLTVDSL